MLRIARLLLPATLALVVLTGAPSLITAQIQGRQAVTVRDAALDLELLRADLSDDGGSIAIAMAARPRGKMSAPAELSFATIEGDRVAQRWTSSLGTLATVDAKADKRVSLRRALVGFRYQAAGAPVIVLMNEAGRTPVLVQTAPGGPAEGTRRPLGLKGDPEIQAAVESGNGLRLVGNTDAKFFIAQIGLDGSALSQQVISTTAAVIEDVRATSDGGLLVLGRPAVLEAGASAGEELPLWVAKISAKGQLEHETKLEGRSASIAQLRNGDIVLISYRREARTQALHVVALDASLREKWSKLLLNGLSPTAPPFRIAATAAGGFVIAGAKDRGLWVTHFDQAGNQVWNDARIPGPPDMDMVFNIEVLSAGGTAHVVYTAFTVDGREQRQVIRAVRYTF